MSAPPTPRRRWSDSDPLRAAYWLTLATALIVILGGGLCAAWSPHYNFGAWMHDLVLLVLGIGVVTFAISRQPLISTTTHVSSPTEAFPPRRTGAEPTTYQPPPTP
jgi:hypothetical protein